MARPRKTDEILLVVPVRLPESFVAALDDAALNANVSRSDILRERININTSGISVSLPIQNTEPRLRRGRVEKASATDPALLLKLAGISNNINQIARAVNTGAVSGKHADALSVLIALESIEQQITRLRIESTKC